MPNPLSLAFDLPFEDAIAAARARKVELPEDYYRRAPGEARRAATTISGLSALDQIQAVFDAVDDAIAGGSSFGQWKQLALAQGWGLPRGRLETVVRTSAQTAYAQGHWRSFQANKARRPYLMWSAINDSRVRPAHLAMDGYVAPIDDPIWKVWHPPAGYNCRCTQISLTEAQARARGYGSQLRPQAEPDPGFGDGEPGSLASSLAKAIEQRWAQCKVFTFGKTRRTKPFWCLDDGRKALERVERQLEDRHRVVPSPEAVAIVEFVSRPSRQVARNEVLLLGDVENAAAIHEATGQALVGFRAALDFFGVRHAFKKHGDVMKEAPRGQRAVMPADFLRVPEILANFDMVEFVGRAHKSGEPLLKFTKRFGNETYVYEVAIRQGRRMLASHDLWVILGGRAGRS